MNPFKIVFRYFIFAVLFILAEISLLQAQVALDTVKIEEVRVKGYENNRELIEIPGTIHLLSPEVWNVTDETSLVQGINTLPGIQMEQRSPASYRISIRGSSLRSPFDVRNVKIYWNGVPFTDPSGITPLNLLDPAQVGSLEVLKGPSASIYGAGNGGTLLMYSETPPIDGKKIQFESLAGSYGLRRISGSLASGNRTLNHSLRLSHQQSDGYREHTAMERTTLQYFSTLYPSEKRKITLNIFGSDLFYQVPGGLTEEQLKANPRQARPSSAWFPGSVAQNSSVHYKTIFSSMGHSVRHNQHWTSETNIYARHSFFEMPFITDYERETRQGWGGRSQLRYTTKLGNSKLPFTWLGGIEYQQELLEGRNFGNDRGKPDTLNFDDEVRAWQGLVFTKAEIEFPSKIFLDASLSLNNQHYDIYRLYDAILDTSFRTKKSFDPVWMPRIGILKKMNTNVAVFASVSKGFSPPSVKEVRTGDGQLNIDLQPEEGTNYEFGYRTEWLDQRLLVDITFFDFSLSETIVSYTDSFSNVVKFRNSGATIQRGIEILASWMIRQKPGAFLETINLQTSHSYHRFRFNEFQKDGEDFSGNDLTGVAPHRNVSILSMNFRPGLYWHAIGRYADKIPLNDENSVYADAYFVMDTRIGLKKRVDGFTFEIFGGINNLFDEIYSLGNDLNPYGQRFYQPAPGRNIYMGLKINPEWK